MEANTKPAKFFEFKDEKSDIDFTCPICKSKNIIKRVLTEYVSHYFCGDCGYTITYGIKQSYVL